MSGTRADIVDWLLGEARTLPDLGALLGALGRRLIDAGLPVHRLNYGFQTLHPEVRALTYLWQADRDEVTTRLIDFETQNSAVYLVSPVRIIYEGGDMVRCRLEGEDANIEYRFLEDMQAEGYTDYLALALPLHGGKQSPFTLSSKAPGGFSDDDIARVRAFLPALGLLVDLHASMHLSRSLLDVYLGHGTGERVLAGAIRRGTVRRIPAAIFFCDLRGFTALSETLPRDRIIHVLNDWFGAVGTAIDEYSGEILKFIGDAALAIFPVGDDTATEACAKAWTAACKARANIAALNERRAAEGKPELRYGMALHVGEVLYGNIGAPGRLDFTVIGPAVNRAARLEGLASRLGRPLVVSADFNALAGPFESLGSFELKGIDGLVEAFAPADE
ncbi:MAG: adenylate/guanylate cyclase domain-containing protein [Pseudomonadota bacterium]|nr:adenylate/guanylate cyclase domain-containing protein [Pseudomonadota bacterium]